MIFELRRYALAPNAMPAMHHRMEDELLPMFPRHGFHNLVGAWEGISGPGTPVYIWMLAWTDYQARADAWRSFHSEWSQKRSLERATAFNRGAHVTMIEPWENAAFDFSESAAAVDELWLLHLSMQPDRSSKAETFEKETAALKVAGASLFGGFDVVFGSIPQAALFLSWPDAGSFHRGVPIYQSEMGHHARRARTADNPFSSAIESVDRYFLKRAPYWPTPGIPKPYVEANTALRSTT